MELLIRKNIKYILVMLTLVLISIAVNLHFNIFSQRFALQMGMIPLFQKPSSILAADTSMAPKFTILFWTPWYGDSGIVTTSYFRPMECADEYVIISNKSLLHLADAIIFQYVDLRRSSLPSTRNFSVPWILALQESPINLGPLKWNRVFNFTWAPRTDSEIHPEFVEMYEKYEEPDERWIYGSNFSHQFIRNKTKVAAWVVSSFCHSAASKRSALVDELAKYGFPVDIYGKCGTLYCAPDESCFVTLGQQYKFYMALENSLCVDYVTEKPSHGWSHNMVPIIYALGKKEMLAPPNSYIDALEFETVETLAEYLKFLDENPKEYFKYFEWRSLYNLTSSAHSAYHCYTFRKVKEVTEALRVANSSLNYGKGKKYADMNRWYSYFYHSGLKMHCKSCLNYIEVNVTNLKDNKLNVYNNPRRCIESTH